MAKSEAPRQQLGRATWIKAALDILAGKGLDGIRVEVLAKRLKVTKGSFYWHFKDRRDLLDAVLEPSASTTSRSRRAVPGGAPRAYHVIEVQRQPQSQACHRDRHAHGRCGATAVVESTPRPEGLRGARHAAAGGSSRNLLLTLRVRLEPDDAQVHADMTG